MAKCTAVAGFAAPAFLLERVGERVGIDVGLAVGSLVGAPVGAFVGLAVVGITLG